jgi:probable HAF family extracellular repeat protein
VVVGYAGVGGNAVFHAFRWTGGVMTDLGTFPGGANSFASGVNGDGSVIAGWSNTPGNTAFFTGVHAYRWTSGGGFQDLGTLGGSNSLGFAVSNDGLVVVCRADTFADSLPFRWTSASGMQSLGTLGGSNPAVAAFGVNTDGSVVVGQSVTSTGDAHAFKWTAAAGMKDLNTLLAAAGVNMTGITLTIANGVSSNGFIVGQGNFPSGANHAYIVRYDDGNGSRTFTKDDCKDGGWMQFTSSPGPFKNQGQCVSYFAHQK